MKKLCVLLVAMSGTGMYAAEQAATPLEKRAIALEKPSKLAVLTESKLAESKLDQAAIDVRQAATTLEQAMGDEQKGMVDMHKAKIASLKEQMAQLQKDHEQEIAALEQKKTKLRTDVAVKELSTAQKKEAQAAKDLVKVQGVITSITSIDNAVDKYEDTLKPNPYYF